MNMVKRQFIVEVGYNEKEHILDSKDVLRIMSKATREEIWGKGYLDNVSLMVSVEAIRE